jgi:hypothetical protein
MNRRDFIKLSALILASTASCSSKMSSQGQAQMVQAFDTRHPASPQWYQDAYTAGYRLMVLSSNTWGRNAPWPQAPTMLGWALDAGLKIAAYTRNPNWWRTGIEACAPHIGALQFFCLDIEIDPGVPVNRAMVDGVQSMGVRPLIYSGAAMWPKIMGNDTSFADLPLWDADHDRSGPVPYGGWNTPNNMRVGVQYTEEANFNGVNINISDFSADFLR